MFENDTLRVFRNLGSYSPRFPQHLIHLADRKVSPLFFAPGSALLFIFSSPYFPPRIALLRKHHSSSSRRSAVIPLQDWGQMLRGAMLHALTFYLICAAFRTNIAERIQEIDLSSYQIQFGRSEIGRSAIIPVESDSALLSTELQVPPGYFGTISDQSNELLARICPRGFYCTLGEKKPCPAGTFGFREGATTSDCDGACPEGFYCPLGYAGNGFDFPCPLDPSYFCPLSSAYPQSVRAGYFTLRNLNTLGGGYSREVICPRGHYCSGGIKYLCPAGYYGDRLGQTNSSCSGPCRSGFYCPPGSVSKFAFYCGNDTSFCPEKSAYPRSLTKGYYLIGSPTLQSIADSEFRTNSVAHHKTTQALCQPGYYCPGNGLKIPCAAGYLGLKSGHKSPSCDGPCPEGYYCTHGSTLGTIRFCGSPQYFCPLGSPEPLKVREGYYSYGGRTGSTQTKEIICDIGYYCRQGIRIPCPAGRFGNETGLRSVLCSGLCRPGFYCPLGSKSETEFQCGHPSKYCPAGSAEPTFADSGYYTIGLTDGTRSSQLIAPVGYYAQYGNLFRCRAGYFGNTEGLSDSSCSGVCNVPGFYCPEGSTSPYMKLCGSSSVYCPSGSSAPLSIQLGFYASDFRDPCPPGQFRNNSPVFSGESRHMVVNSQLMYSVCQLCPEGKYKIQTGDSFSLCLSCNSTFQSTSTSISSSPNRMSCNCSEVVNSNEMTFFNYSSRVCEIQTLSKSIRSFEGNIVFNNSILTQSSQFPCEPGHFCKNGVRYLCPPGRFGRDSQSSDSNCSGLCQSGYYCPAGSTSEFAFPCGGQSVYCPPGSEVPKLVDKGYYSNENSSTQLREFQIICPLGHYCPGDGLRYPCPPGTFSDVEGTSSESCLGNCDAGYFCLTGSTNRRQYPCGDSSLFCPSGSSFPIKVKPGFYCAFSGKDSGKREFWDLNKTSCSAEIPCEPGYYCVDGLRYPCPPGRYGWRYGLSSDECSGYCAPGYYCPSILSPQIDAPLHTVWPNQPQTSATTFECGSTLFYCPRGSFYPQVVDGGYYTTGGGQKNNTRSAQLICPKGSFCQGGIALSCPEGFYGNQTGLANSQCSGFCPAGYYCPQGTIEPLPCPAFSFSNGGAASCSKCSGYASLTQPLKCNTSKFCCSLGN